jgi:clan AA aspartic protease
MGFIHTPVRISAPGAARQIYEDSFLVDTGATDSLAPASELERIGLPRAGKKTYELADGRLQEFDFGLAQIEVMGEITAGRIIFAPEGTQPILGVTALESVGITVDPSTHSLKRLPAIRL